MINYLIKEYGGIPACYDIVKDDIDQLEHALDKALSENDIVLMSGGSSKGEEDFTIKLFEKKGKLLTHWVKAVPGRPMGVALAAGKPLINLSGPTLASFNGMEWCVREIIAKYMNVPAFERPSAEVVLQEPLMIPPILSALKMFLVSKNDDGILIAKQAGGFGPGPKGRPGQKTAPEKHDAADDINPLIANAYYMSSLGEKPHEKGDKIIVKLLCSIDEIV
jgi:molybdopterin molybdotransferase/putative molybdopterin biosynthesis protein